MQHRPAPEPPADVPPRFAVALSLASLAGVLTVSPMLVEPLWPLAWVGLMPLFVALRGVSAARAFALGWWTETLMYGLGTYWLVNTMVDFGYIPLPLSLVFFVIVAAANGVRLGLFAWWVRRMQTVRFRGGTACCYRPAPSWRWISPFRACFPGTSAFCTIRPCRSSRLPT